MGKNSRLKKERREQENRNREDNSREQENKNREDSKLEKYYTVKQVAEIANVTDKTVRSWMKKGKLKYEILKPGIKDKYRIKESEVKKIFEEVSG